MTQVNVTIIGLNKIGTSFGLALKAFSQKANSPYQFTITGSDYDAPKIKAAQDLGAIDQSDRNMVNAVQKANIVIAAFPYNRTEELFRVIGPNLKPGTVVMDTSSLKLGPITWANKHFRRNSDHDLEAYLVGVTPIINPAYLGDHRTDTAAAHADLFQNGLMVVSPSQDCPGEAVQLITDLSTLLGIKSHFVDPIEHDGMMAAMEGLPLLVQLALFRSLNQSPSWDDLRWLSNPNFFLATYALNEGNPEDAGTFLHETRQSLARRLDTLIDNLNQIRDLLNVDDALTIGEAFQEPMQRYSRWREGRNNSDWNGQRQEQMPSAFRLMGNMFMPQIGRRKSKDKDAK